MTDQPTVPPEVALGDRHLRVANERVYGAQSETAAIVAQAHYQRQIALVLTDLVDLFEHQHTQHGAHGEQARAEAQEHPHLEEPHA